MVSKQGHGQPKLKDCSKCDDGGDELRYCSKCDELPCQLGKSSISGNTTEMMAVTMAM